MDTLMITLGDELRTSRKRKGWTRRELLVRLPFDVSFTDDRHLGAGAPGTSRLSASTTSATCSTSWSRNCSPECAGASRAPANVEICLDIEAAARTTQARLGPVRAWAQCRLQDLPERRWLNAQQNQENRPTW